jgi:hypothetical protein
MIEMPKRNYETLDALVVMSSVFIVGGGVAGLMFLKVPSENLAVVAGLLGTMLGTIIGGYAGFRWGASTKDLPQPAARPPLVFTPPAEETR